jgi:hypothetical protein
MHFPLSMDFGKTNSFIMMKKLQQWWTIIFHIDIIALFYLVGWWKDYWHLPYYQVEQGNNLFLPSFNHKMQKIISSVFLPSRSDQKKESYNTAIMLQQKDNVHSVKMLV